MRAAVKVGARLGKAKRAFALAIGSVALLVAAEGSAQVRPLTARVPGAAAGGRHDVNLIVLDPNDAPIAGTIITVQHLGAVHQLVSDQQGIARQAGAMPHQPSLSGVSVGFAGAGETFGVVAAHPTWGAVVRAFDAHRGCDGCGPATYTYRVDMGGPQLAVAPAISRDPVEVGAAPARCSEGETYVELRFKEARDEPCKSPHGVPLGCTVYLCGQSIALVSGAVGARGSTSVTQTLEHEIAGEGRTRLLALGVKITTKSSSSQELSSEVTSTTTWNWEVGKQELPRQFATYSGDVCARTQITTYVFEQWRAVCEAIPPVHPATTSSGTRWRWINEGNTEIPLPMGTCIDYSKLQPDPRCTKDG